jgi:Histone methylation protein DOT1
MHTNLSSILSEIQSNILAIEDCADIYKETSFEDRADAIDYIDFNIIDRISGLLQKKDPKKDLDKLKKEAELLKSRFEKIDAKVFRRIRALISADHFSKSSFKSLISTYLSKATGIFGLPEEMGYDNLDLFINGLLSNESIPQTILEMKPEMVSYQKTPARITLQMVELAAFKQEDAFFDIGSGLGQVAILVNLISGVKTRGIEYEPAYCNYARNSISALNLSNIEFVNLDARDADYSEGTIFYLYSPFEGTMLQDIWRILHRESGKRRITLFTYGPCSIYAGREGWLTCLNGPGNDPHKLYQFRSQFAER